MTISASDVSRLRAQTGAGMMDCKNALEESNGDLKKATECLRKKGIAKATKRENKIATEGIVNVKVDGNTAVVLEVNSETDFVANNDDFKKVVENLTEVILKNKPANVTDALKQDIDGKTVAEYLTEITGKIGEKIVLRRIAVVNKEDDEVFGPYIHMGGKIGALVVLTNCSDVDLARDIAMQVAASYPKYLNRETVPVELVNKEKEIFTEQLKKAGKPENIIDNILKGKVEKFYSEICLVDQIYVKDDKKKVKEVLPDNSEIKEYIRFELGEGLEKENTDFATEVAEQLEK